ncbi:hypothetical protein BD413DRAFT_477129 [Trametes elegans]|nr:hypothetical protein BD413DRAFT_477129 [Trametes elegans]
MATTSRNISRVLSKFSPRTSTPESRTTVLSLLREKQALTIQELYTLAQQRQQEQQRQAIDSGATNPPEPAIPSMRYLKKVVLTELAEAGEVEKVHRRHQYTPEEFEALRAQMSKAQRASASREVALFQWQIKRAQPPPPAAAEDVRPFGAEVGVGADWGHLNRRRRRAREGKVDRDVEWMKELSKARSEGAKA